MLAFNLGIFFRNLKDAEVDFSAKNAVCQVAFSGQVQALSDQVDLTRHLAVTLRRGDLVCFISFDEQEDEDTEQKKEEEALVQVRIAEERDGTEQVLVETQFRFEDISLKPHSPDAPEPPQDPAQAA
jgi:hypothetical protein